jgi:hypothetical protein
MLVSGLPPDTHTGRQSVPTGTTLIIRMHARPTVITARAGLRAESLSAPAPGITEAGDTGTTAAAITGAVVGAGATTDMAATTVTE